MRKSGTVLAAFGMLLGGIVSVAAFDVPDQGPDSEGGRFISKGYVMQSIEYWHSGGYNNGVGVTFGYDRTEVPTARTCAKRAHDTLREILAKDLPEMREMRRLNGPQGIYIIVSDWTTQPEQDARPASVWHYNASEPSKTRGLMKFHAHTKGDVCNVPTEADVVAFAESVKRKIEAAAAAQAAEQPAVVQAPVPVAAQKRINRSGTESRPARNQPRNSRSAD